MQSSCRYDDNLETELKNKDGVDMKLTVGCGAYDRTWPLIASTIQIDDVEFEWNIVPPEVAFTRGMVDGEFEIS